MKGLKHFLSWLVQKKAALVALAAAVGAFVHAAWPALGESTGELAGDGMLVVAVIAAMLAAYNGATTGDGKDE